MNSKILKRALKQAMRGKRPLDEKTNKPKIDPETNKPYPLENPRQIIAYDVIKYFEKNMTLDQAVVFLERLEEEDVLVTKTEIEDIHEEGIFYVYHYEHKNKKRGDR